jgi:hypothetical protein
MSRVSPEEIIDYKNELLKTDLGHDTIGNHIAALRTLFRYAKPDLDSRTGFRRGEWWKC